MKKNILLSFATTLLLSGSLLHASALHEKQPNVNVPEQTLHSYYGFYASPDKLTKQQLEHYHKIGLISKQQMIKDELKLATKNIAKPSKEILDGLNATFKAMTSLKRHDLKSAETLLTTATNLFDRALKKEPNLKLVPIDIQTVFDDHALTLENVTSIKKNALRMVNDNQPQEAIALLSQLKNQITMDITYLPMDTYPISTKKALDALKKGDKEDIVLPMLLDALSTKIVIETTIPLPVLIAQNALKDASKLTKDKQEIINELLNLAQKQLEIAKFEGYLTTYDTEYKVLSKEISTLKKKVSEGNILVKDYDEIKKDFTELFAKIHQGTKK